MEPMTWSVIAGLIVKYGIPFTEYLINLAAAQGTPAPAEWATLKLLAGVSARQEALDRLTAAGIPITDPRAVTLLSLMP